MNKEEMLKKSGLTDEEFKELVHKFKAFLESLNPAQRAAVDRWLPSAEKIAASFGPALTVKELAKNVGCGEETAASIAQEGVGLSAPGNGGDGNS